MYLNEIQTWREVKDEDWNAQIQSVQKKSKKCGGQLLMDLISQ